MSPTLDLAMGLMDNDYTSGSNSVVEFLPSKQAVAGSNPVSRSNRTIQARSVCESTGQP